MIRLAALAAVIAIAAIAVAQRLDSLRQRPRTNSGQWNAIRRPDNGNPGGDNAVTVFYGRDSDPAGGEGGFG